MIGLGELGSNVGTVMGTHGIAAGAVFVVQQDGNIK